MVLSFQKYFERILCFKFLSLNNNGIETSKILLKNLFFKIMSLNNNGIETSNILRKFIFRYSVIK